MQQMELFSKHHQQQQVTEAVMIGCEVCTCDRWNLSEPKPDGCDGCKCKTA